jgi:predicted RNase H-like HicB family nuclease
MVKISLKNVVWKEGKYYVAWNLNTGVSSFGDSRKESLQALEEALDLYFEEKSTASFNRIERPGIIQMEYRHA